MKTFKNMDKTKRWLLIFIVVVFVGIGGISLYRSFQPDQDKDYITRTDIANQTDEDKNTDIKPTTEEKTETKKQQETPEKKEPSKETPSKSKQKEQQDNTKKETTKEETKQETPVVESNTISIHLEVKGMNERLIFETVDVKKGSTAFSVLKEIATQKQMKVTTSGFGTMVYVTGIGDLKEKQHGNSSGWLYKVNDVSPNKSAGSYELKDGDRVQWYYVYENNED